MSVKYGGNRLIPGPVVNVDKAYVRTGAGNPIGMNYTLTINGKLLPDRGSPGSGSFYTGDDYPADESTTDNFGSLLRKKELLRDLFATDGQLLEFKSCEGTVLTCYPTSAEVTFPEGQWYTSLNYTINLSAPFVSGVGTDSDEFNEYISSASETWGLEASETHEGPEQDITRRLVHNVSAVGKRIYDDSGAGVDGWQEARKWVYPRLGLDNNFLHGTSGLNLPTHYTGYDYVRTENSDELDGTYSVTENWTISSGSAIEEFSISVNTSTESYIDKVSAQGNIRGLEVRSSDYYTVSSTKWTNALSKYNDLIGSSDVNTIYNRSLDYSGYTNLNPTPLSKVVGKNPTNGTINYSFEYDTRATNYVSGAKYETINVADTHQADIYGEVFALGRIGGPVLQDLGTKTKTQRALSVDVVMQPYSGVNSLTTQAGITTLFSETPKTQVDDLVNAFKTNLDNTYDQVFTDNDTDNWDVRAGRYSRNVTWSYGECSGVI